MATRRHDSSTRAHGAPRCGSAGFTLIEILCAMAILLLIMVAMGRIYASSTKAYSESMKQVERDSAARAVMDYIAREISMSMFENPNVNTNAMLTMRYKANTFKNNFGLEGADELWFVAGSGDPSSSSPRHAQQIVYYMTNSVSDSPPPANAQFRYRLQRGVYEAPSTQSVGGVWSGYYDTYYAGTNGRDWAGTIGASASAPKPGVARPVMDNIRTFEVFVYTNATGKTVSRTSNGDIYWDSREPTSLFCIDLYLETMSDAAATKAALLAATLGPNNARTIEFVESSVRRHYQRVYFPNKMAYYDQPFL